MEIVKYELNENLITFLDESTEVIVDFDYSGLQEVSEGVYVNPEYINATFGGSVLLGTGEMISGDAYIERGISISLGRVINPKLIVVVLTDRIEMLNSTIYNITEEDKEKLK